MGINNVADILRTHARERADEVALVLGDREVTWAELYERASRVAAGLQAAGVGPRDRVAFLEKNGIEHFEVFYGAALLNAVCVDVNWRLAPPEVEFIVNDATAKVFVVGQDFVPVLDAIADSVSAGTILVIGGHDKHRDYDEWVGEHEPADPHEPSGPDDVAFQLYSSGTTGRPKGVMLSNDNFFALLPVATEMWEFRPDSVNLVAMPLFHIGGGGWAVAGQFVGCEEHHHPRPRPVGADPPDPRARHHPRLRRAGRAAVHADGARRRRRRLLHALGRRLRGVADQRGRARPQRRPARLQVLAGLRPDRDDGRDRQPAAGGPRRREPPPPPLVRRRRAGRRAAHRRPGHQRRTSPTGEVGEIWVRGPQIMLGYWNNEAATRESIDDDGWFRSGDAGYLDADGYLYIHDRVKDMIVSGGENVYPAEVENVLMKHPGIADVAVIGVPHEKWGETAKAIVVRAPDTEATPEEIIAFSRQHLAKFKCPTSVDFVDVLPRNPSGKVLKKDLRA